jgi:hypothetical protein
MNMYQLRVSIVGMGKLYRIIEASGNCTFDDLHHVIFQAFDRGDPHMYSFFITKKDVKSTSSIYKSPEITHPMGLENGISFGRETRSSTQTRIDDVKLDEKDVFFYLFDFGDEWWHRIRVQSITESEATKEKSIRIAKSVGDSPPQYPEYEEDEF